MPESVKVYPGRPPFVTHDGKQVCISVHDTYYFEERKRLRAALAAAHPDRWIQRGGEWRHPLKKDWQKALNAVERFNEHELAWYATYKLTPPSKATMTDADRRWSTRRAKHGPSGHTAHGLGRIKAGVQASNFTARWAERKRKYGPSGTKAPKTHCRKGHSYAEHGRIIPSSKNRKKGAPTRRLCSVCYRAAQRRAYKRQQVRKKLTKVA